MPAEPRKGITDPLDDEEDEADAGDPPENGGGNQLQTVVVQMSKILQRMTRDKKVTNLEDVLDRADGGMERGASSSSGRSKAAAYQRLKTLLRTSPSEVSRSIESCMQEDFNLAQSGPGLEVRACTARAWVEHRSLLQSYSGPIRQAWTLAGVVDALNSGDSELAKAMALLGIASLDQAAVDGGSWLLASEISLEPSPPFGAFSRPRVLDTFESRQTRLLDPRWISILMGRIKEREAYHTAKKNLGGGAGVGGGAANPGLPSGGGRPEGPSGAEATPDGKGPRKPPKGGGRGEKGDKGQKEK